MRFLICAMISLVSVFAHADNVKCTNPAGLDALIYNPEKMTASFVSLGRTGLPIPRDIAISGEVGSRAGLTEDYSIFTYPLANGQSVEITWVSGESEIWRGLRGQPTSAVVKDRAGAIVEKFADCGWTDRI